MGCNKILPICFYTKDNVTAKCNDECRGVRPLYASAKKRSDAFLLQSIQYHIKNMIIILTFTIYFSFRKHLVHDHDGRLPKTECSE